MDNTYILGPNGDLYHWGIKGMKWGIRRYQNKDGSLTPAGKKRRAKLEAEIEKLGGKSGEKSGNSTVKSNVKKSVKDMTDDELNKAVNRARLESEYNRLNPKQKTILEQLSEKALHDVLIPSAMNAGKAYLEKVVSKYSKESGPSINDLLKKYGDMTESERERYKNAAMVKGWENTILGKKNNK